MAVASGVVKSARIALARIPRDRQSLRTLLWPESGALSPIPALDGVRALAALLVLLFHVWSDVPGYAGPTQHPASLPLFYGKTGVNLFFVLSGFLLFQPYAQWILGLRARPSVLAFYKRRALRVGPAYWVSLVLLAFTVPFSLATVGDFALHIFFLANVSWNTMYTFNGVFWTMAIEVQFYATLPLIAWGMYALSRRVRPGIAIAVGLATLLCISLAAVGIEMTGRLTLTPFVNSFLISFASLPYWIIVFGFGIGCASFYTYATKIAKFSAEQRRVLRRVSTVTFFGGIALALASAFPTPLQHSPVLDQTFGLAYAGLLLGVLLGPTLCRRLFESRPMRFVGLISYSFYIWHKVVEVAAAHVVRGLPFFQQEVALFALTLAGTLVVAYVSYQFVERPFINARKRAHEVSTVAPVSVPTMIAEPAMSRN